MATWSALSSVDTSIFLVVHLEESKNSFLSQSFLFSLGSTLEEDWAAPFLENENEQEVLAHFGGT